MACAALVPAVLAVGYGVVLAGRLETAVAAVGLLGLVVLVVALAGDVPGLVAWAIAVFGAEYAFALLLRGDQIDDRAPLVGAALLLVAELSYWTLEPQLPEAPAIARRRLGRLAVLTLVGGGTSALVLAVSELAVSGGLGIEALGVAAAAGALALVALLARAAARREEAAA